MIHYFYGTLQVGIGQTLCSFEHVSCFNIIITIIIYNYDHISRDGLTLSKIHCVQVTCPERYKKLRTLRSNH